MRMVSWNCGSGSRRKIAALSALDPDIAIVQVCADLDTLVLKAMLANRVERAADSRRELIPRAIGAEAREVSPRDQTCEVILP